MKPGEPNGQHVKIKTAEYMKRLQQSLGKWGRRLKVSNNSVGSFRDRTMHEATQHNLSFGDLWRSVYPPSIASFSEAQ